MTRSFHVMHLWRIATPVAMLACTLTATAQVVAPEQVAAAAAADAAAAGSSTPSQWGLGLGAGVERRALRAFDDDVDALPLVLYESARLSVFGARIDYKLPSYGPLQFRLRARYANDGYEAKDSPYLSGMAERKGGVWLGGAAIWRSGATSLAFEATSAVGDAEGRRLKLELNREFRSGALTVTPRVAANWYDRKYVDYYYGVRAGEARAGRGAFSGEASSAIEAGVRFGYTFGQRHNVFVDVGVTLLGSEMKDSPLVERSSERGVRLGYLYAF